MSDFKGKSATEWLKMYGNVVSDATFRRRVKMGWSPEKAASYCTEVKYMINGEFAKDFLARENPSVTYQTFISRVHNGWDIESAARTPAKTKRGAYVEKEMLSKRDKDLLAKIEALGKGVRLVWHKKKANEIMCRSVAHHIADLAEQGKIICFQRVTKRVGDFQEIEYIAEGV